MPKKVSVGERKVAGRSATQGSQAVRPEGDLATRALSFRTRAELETWLKENHDRQTELWVRMFKKGSGTPSIDWKESVLGLLAWGWIDGQRRALDEASFLQRSTPRRAKSTWSKINREHAERLIAEGRMHPPGLAQVKAAQSDGRWERAYAGSKEMEIPEDFLSALAKNAPAKKCFATLDRRNLFTIYLRLTTAKRPDTRQKRIAQMIAQLAAGEPFH
jgi:uncharacterized protein YdeI (YjbR/CyaY-like superfamily)